VNRVDRLLALAAAAVGVVLVFIGISVVAVEGRLVPAAAYTLVAGVALLITFVVLDPAVVAELARSRRGRFGSLSVLVSAVVIGILVMVNVLASRGGQAADLTRAGLYTLSSKSVVVTHKLDSDLVVTGFFRPDQGDSKRQVQDLLGLYQQQNRHIKLQFEDPDQNAAHALNLGVTIAGSIVLQYKNKQPVVLNLASQTESDVTGAILRLEANRTPTICWATGDGERDLKDTDQANGYSAAADLLKTSNYQTQDLLLSQQAIPPSCDVVAVVGVRRPLSAGSVSTLQAFVNGGGKLLFAFDPWPADPNIRSSVNEVLKPYGVSYSGGLVVEGDAAHQAANNPTTPVAFDFGASPIAKDLARKFVFFVEPTSLVGAPTGFDSVNVVTTTDKAYEIPQPRTTQDRQPGDKNGPFVLMQTLEQSGGGTRKARVVLLGTSAIAENRALPPNASGANPDIFLSTLDWLSQQDDLIGISPKPANAVPLSLTDQQLRLNYFVTLVLLPLLIAALGVLVFVRRRAS
jgi:ABC-2 type transport system permease protein